MFVLETLYGFISHNEQGLWGKGGEEEMLSNFLVYDRLPRLNDALPHVANLRQGIICQEPTGTRLTNNIKRFASLGLLFAAWVSIQMSSSFIQFSWNFGTLEERSDNRVAYYNSQVRRSTKLNDIKLVTSQYFIIHFTLFTEHFRLNLSSLYNSISFFKFHKWDSNSISRE